MSITSKKYGEFNGRDVYAYTLSNEKGLSAEIINYGGAITKLVYNGTDVVLGWDNLEEYVNNSGCYGALVGRNSNRIENAEFELNGKTYKLFANNIKSNLHGGPDGFNNRIWDTECVDEEEPALILRLISPDGDQGFPGEVSVKVTYTLTKDNAISIHYEAECDQDTIINMTNHSYFNPNGHESGSVENCSLWMASSFYTPNNPECCPLGSILPVDTTPFDFREETTIGENLAIKHEQIELFGGYDHNFVIDGRGLRKAAVCTGDKSGISMELFTDCPGVQIYIPTNKPHGKTKDGAEYCRYNAICLETQAFPNSMKYSHFPTTVVKAGEKYDTTTVYKFK